MEGAERRAADRRALHDHPGRAGAFRGRAGGADLDQGEDAVERPDDGDRAVPEGQFAALDEEQRRLIPGEVAGQEDEVDAVEDQLRRDDEGRRLLAGGRLDHDDRPEAGAGSDQARPGPGVKLGLEERAVVGDLDRPAGLVERPGQARRPARVAARVRPSHGHERPFEPGRHDAEAPVRQEFRLGRRGDRRFLVLLDFGFRRLIPGDVRRRLRGRGLGFGWGLSGRFRCRGRHVFPPRRAFPASSRRPSALPRSRSRAASAG